MKPPRGILVAHRTQYAAYLGLGAVILALVSLADQTPFRRFLGSLDPRLVVVAVLLVNAAALGYLLTTGAFSIYRRTGYRGWLLFAALAGGFGAVVIAADAIIIFPRETNVFFPQSLLFYPVMAMLVEAAWHGVPMSLLVLLLSRFRGVNIRRSSWFLVPLVALTDPVFQVIDMVAVTPWGATLFVGVHVYLINLVEMILFRGHSFIAAFAFRLFYYLIWHVIWGYVRLTVLF
ncbi:MAG: hypothetical protein JSV66_11455 [Trueperaceae bacterium]|nr:MAG: hypothetical protein JSV66_11455 [Trueperaceae bacterium]